MNLIKTVCVFLFLMTIYGGFGQENEYRFSEDSKRHPGVPKGMVTEHVWESTLIDGTIRAYYLYVPAQYDRDKGAALMVFQDGHAYVDDAGDFRVPTVFDNLIHKKDMPVTIGLFINPGHQSTELPANPFRASNRSLEYDSLNADYARFLIEELIPEISKIYHLIDDPQMRAICGLSSGGICAFTVAWERPDYFSKVMSHFGSFTNIRGGHQYGAMIRKTPKKNIKVYLQDGSNDLNNEHGNWWLANQQMASALAFKSYDHTFVTGTGAHDGKHGGSVLPEALKWLWSDIQMK